MDHSKVRIRYNSVAKQGKFLDVSFIRNDGTGAISESFPSGKYRSTEFFITSENKKNYDKVLNVLENSSLFVYKQSISLPVDVTRKIVGNLPKNEVHNILKLNKAFYIAAQEVILNRSHAKIKNMEKIPKEYLPKIKTFEYSGDYSENFDNILKMKNVNLKKSKFDSKLILDNAVENHNQPLSVKLIDEGFDDYDEFTLPDQDGTLYTGADYAAYYGDLDTLEAYLRKYNTYDNDMYSNYYSYAEDHYLGDLAVIPIKNNNFEVFKVVFDEYMAFYGHDNELDEEDMDYDEYLAYKRGRDDLLNIAKTHKRKKIVKYIEDNSF